MVEVAVNGQIAVDMVRASMMVDAQEGEGAGVSNGYDFICMDFTMPVMVRKRNNPSTRLDSTSNRHFSLFPSHLLVAYHLVYSITIILYRHHLPSSLTIIIIIITT